MSPDRRPPKSRITRGRHAAAQRVISLFTSSSSNSSSTLGFKSSTTTLADPDSALSSQHQPTLPPPVVLPLTEQERLVSQLSALQPNVQYSLSNPATEDTSPRLFLAKQKRLGPIWKHIGAVHTAEIPFWFDGQVCYLFFCNDIFL